MTTQPSSEEFPEEATGEVQVAEGTATGLALVVFRRGRRKFEGPRAVPIEN